MTTPIHVNNVQTTLASARSVGASTLVMASGYGTTLAARLTALGLTLSPSTPLRVTAIRRSAINAYGQITDPSKATIFEVTGRTGDTLTGATVVEGTTDQSFAAGDVLAALWTAGAAKEILASIAAITIDSLDDVGDVDLTGLAAGSVLRWDAVDEAWEASGALTSHLADVNNPHSVTYTQVGAAAAAHNHDDRYYTKSQIDTTFSSVAPAVHTHSADDITSGTLAVARGGTGATSHTSGAVLVGAGTSAVTSFGNVSGSTLSLATTSGTTGRVQATSHATPGALELNGASISVNAAGDGLVFPDTGAAAQVLTSSGQRMLTWAGASTRSNFFFGRGAGNLTLSGSQNNGFGRSALASLTSGQANVAFGTWTLTECTEGQRNTAVGDSAVALLTFGARNSGVGATSLPDLTTGSRNTAIGDNSGLVVATGDNNTYIGAGTGAASGLTTQAGSIAIGAYARCTANNQAVVGSSTAAISEVYLGTGVTHTAPGNVAVRGSGGSGTNVAGGRLDLCGGAATGNAAGGSVRIRTSVVGSSGASLQSLATGVEVDNLGSVAVGRGAVATDATDGFLYVPTCAGTPTGTPTAKTGLIPIVVDSTNHKLYFYSGGSWRDAGP